MFCQVSNGSHLAGAVVILVRVNSTRGDSLTRRFDIGPVVLAVGALVLLVALFLDWYATFNAWQAVSYTHLTLPTKA